MAEEQKAWSEEIHSSSSGWRQARRCSQGKEGGRRFKKSRWAPLPESEKTPEEEELQRRWTHRPCMAPSKKSGLPAEEEQDVELDSSVPSGAWANLPVPLLEMILAPLPLPDSFRFGAVCRSWNKLERSRPPLRQLPWLMVPHNQLSSIEVMTFCSPSEKAYYTISLPGTGGKYCCASSHGWMLFAEPYSEERFLLNPLSKARIDLPPWRFDTESSHALLSSSPTDRDCVVLFIAGESIIFCRVGDDEWSVRPFWHQPYTDRYCYIATFGGSIYFMYRWNLGVIDVFGDPILKWLSLDGSRLPHLDCLSESDVFRFLVESSGELLLVVMYPYFHFSIFKADLSRMAWVEVRSLGDRSLFLGRGCSISLLAAKISEEGGGKGGRIYVTHPALDPGLLWKEYEIESDADQTDFTALFHRAQDFRFRTSHWIMPSFNSRCLLPS